jgi:hypothetical protein
MNSSFIRGAGLAVITLVLLGSPGLRADEPASFDDVHHLLQEAAGDPDSPPSADQRKDDLGKAIRELDRLPHVYHGRLAKAKQLVQGVIDELSSADASKVRSDILEADDRIKALAE